MSIYQISINDDYDFDMYVDGEYNSTRKWVYEHLEHLANLYNVNLDGCYYESEAYDRLIIHGVRITIK